MAKAKQSESTATDTTPTTRRLEHGEHWVDLGVDGVPIDWHVPVDTVGFCSLSGFFSGSDVAIAERIERVMPALIVWLA